MYYYKKMKGEEIGGFTISSCPQTVSARRVEITCEEYLLLKPTVEAAVKAKKEAAKEAKKQAKQIVLDKISSALNISTKDLTSLWK